MKNAFLSLLLLLAFAATAAAQSVFSLLPNPASATAPVEEDEVIVPAVITNLTNDTIHLNWERRVIELTPGCNTSVLDPYISWFYAVNSKNFYLEAQQNGSLSVAFYNNNQPCAGIVHLKLTNLDNPADTLIGVYLFNQATSTKDLPVANVKLFPNPLTDYFSLENAENVAKIRVFALDGRLMARFDARAGNNVYSLENLPIGNYVISLEDKNGDTFQALELHKR